MKIFHAAETIRGGVATVMRYNMQAQIQEGAHVLALVPADQAGDLVCIPPHAVVPFARTGRNVKSLLTFVKAFHKVMVEFQPDIVHLHSTFAGVLGRGYLALRKLAATVHLCGATPVVVYCPHGWAFLMEGSARKKQVFGAVERVLSWLTDAVVCVSQYEKTEALRYGLAAEKMKVIYNGVPPSPVAVHDKKPVVGRFVNLIFVGRLDYQKGFDILEQAMALLKDAPCHLTVVGSAVHGQAQAEAERGPQNISYTGWLKPSEVLEHLSQADVLVMPSRWEGFAMVPLEAMSCGIPVLATRCCSFPEVVEEGQTGCLVPVGDAKALAAVLRETPLTEWHRMGQKARTRYQKHFTADTMTAATWALYRTLQEQKA